MFDAFRRSWELAKATLAVLRSDKELLIFPFIPFLALVVVTTNFRAETMSRAFRSKAGGTPGFGQPL